jgi:methyl-accepting chemotaxis protein
MSGTAANEIGKSIADGLAKAKSLADLSQTRIDNIIKSNTEHVTQAQATASSCRELFSGIQVNVSEIQERFRGILASSDQQSRGLDEIKLAIFKLEEISTQQSQLSQSTKVTVSNLEEGIETVQEISKNLRMAA